MRRKMYTQLARCQAQGEMQGVVREREGLAPAHLLLLPNRRARALAAAAAGAEPEGTPKVMCTGWPPPAFLFLFLF